MTIRLEISLLAQQLSLYETDAYGKERLAHQYPVSTAANGAGEQNGSFQTPRGLHVIAEKIGADAPLYAVFRARKFTGEIWTPQIGAAQPECDWILSRILWLAGCEPGKNLGGDVDTQSRYIYLHGTHAESLVGTAVSHGCIRMKNADIMALFNLVKIGTAVNIVD
ncbi:MAG: L,D-transpeptidase family protein [Sulfuriferula sp.]